MEYKYFVEDTKDFNKTIKIIMEDRSVYLHNKYNPVIEAKRLIEKINFLEMNTIIFYGFGLGYHIEELIPSLGKRDLIIIYEPDVEIFKIAKELNISKRALEDDRIFIIQDVEIDEFITILSGIINWTDFESCQVFCLPYYENYFKEQYLYFLKSFREIIQKSYIDRNTILCNQFLWTELLCKNIPHILDSYNISQFSEKFKDKPVIVVSAGPSLHKNIQLLHKIKGKVCIIAVFSAMEVFKKYNILPDFIISVDSNQKGMDSYSENIPILFISISNDILLNNHKGNKIFINSSIENFSNNLFDEYKKDVQLCELGGSVACVATSIAHKIFKANKVILMGQDLAYTNMKCHADGTIHNDNNRFTLDGKFQVEDIYGDKVYTDKILNSYKLWFEIYIKKYEKEFKLIDATEGGAKIKGSEVITLKEAISCFTENEFIAIDDTLVSVFEKNKLFTKDEKNEILGKMDSLKTNVFEFLPSISRACEICEEIYNSVIKNNTISLQKEKEIQKIHDQFNSLEYLKFIINFILQGINYTINPDFFDEEYTKKHIFVAKQNIEYYNYVKSAIITLTKIMEGIDYGRK